MGKKVFIAKTIVQSDFQLKARTFKAKLLSKEHQKKYMFKNEMCINKLQTLQCLWLQQ